jgi:hypothetical protein
MEFDIRFTYFQPLKTMNDRDIRATDRPAPFAGH